MILLLAVACSSGPCRDGDLKKVSEALGVVDAHYRQPLAAQGLVEACDLPAPVAEGLTGIARGMPGMGAMLDAKVAADAPDLWSAACPGGPGALADSMRAGGPDGRRALYAACALDRHGWGADAFAKASGPVVLPIVLAHLMADEAPFHRDLAITALAGL